MASIGLLHLHSAIRYFILILFIGSLFTAYYGFFGNRPYTNIVRKLHLSTRILVNFQALVGLALYFLFGFYHAWTNLSIAAGRFGFFAFGHLFGMIIGIALINIGHQKSLKAETDKAKYKSIVNFYTIGLLIIFFLIPWPFLHVWASWF